MSTSHRIPESRCLSCGTLIQAATNVDNETAPIPNESLTVCLHCGHIMGFDESLRLRELTKEEAHAVAGDKRILAIQRARKLMPVKGRKNESNSD